MKLLMENWRKFLKEEELIKENIGDFYDTLSEDDLYDLEYEDLVELRAYIENFGGPGPRSDPNDLYPTIVARIEAIEESAEAEWEEGNLVETDYSGEYAMKLAKAFIGSSKQGIDLALMVPDTESLVEEFRRIRNRVQELLEYAEDNDDSPWMDRSANDPDRHTYDSPAKLVRSVEALIKQLTYYPGEITWDDKDEALEEKQKIFSMYYDWERSMENLGQYAEFQLHGTNPTRPWQEGFMNDYDFIKEWAGED